MSAFRSIGAIGVGFNSAMTPGAPPGFQAGDILVAGFVENAGSDGAPDLSAFGFTQQSNNSVVKAPVLYTKTAQGTNDAMPSAQFGAGAACCFCAAYTGLTENVDQIAVFRGSNTTSNFNIPGAVAPPSNGTVAICLAMRNPGSASGISITNYGSFIQRASNVITSAGRPICVFEDIVMTTPQAITLGAQLTNPADSVAQTTQAVIIFLQALVPSTPVGDDELPVALPRRAYSRANHEFWQVPLELRTFVAPQQPPASRIDAPAFLLRPRSNVMLGIEQGTPVILYGQDRVLTPVDWNYSWDRPQLPAYLQYYGQGFDASDMTNLTNYAPYLEYNWPVPLGLRQWNRGFEQSINLNLVGKDQILLTGPNNLQWDPPRGPARSNINRGFEQNSLSLFYTVPLKPPLTIEWPVPPRPRQPVQDFVQGTPETILAALTVFPPFQPSIELPPRRLSLPAVLLAYEWSRQSILAGKDLIPFGTRYDERQVRIFFNASLYTIGETSQFLIPSGPLPPTGGLGVRHVGRVVIDPADVGEAVNVPFDFISGCTAGEVVVSAVTTCVLYSGADPSPQSIITAAATASGTLVLQQCTPTITGNVYDLKCTATTSLGQILILNAYFAIIPGVP